MKSLEYGISFVRNLEQLRYKTGVICGYPQSGKSRYASELARTAPLLFVDVLAEILPKLPEPLGAYDHTSLIRYIENTDKNNVLGTILDDVEPLLATFGKERARAFFLAFSRVEARKPIIVVTHLDKMLEANFTRDRVLYLTT